jgi:hypothetical protein
METNKWIWQPFDKLDKYQLDTPITDYIEEVTLLKRYEEETCDTYSINAYDLAAMLCVSEKDGLVKSIVSSHSFVYEDYEFIGKPMKEGMFRLLQIFGQPIHKYGCTYYMYINPQFEIRLGEFENKIVDVVITSWGNHDN